MKIKQRKYLSEKEALNWLVDNSETLLGIEFEKNAYGDKFFGCDFRYDERLGRTEDGRYCITEEVEIDEDTQLNLVDIYKEYKNVLEVALNNDVSVKQLVEQNKDSGFDTLFIYLQNPDGSIGELIWKDGEMVD